MTGRDLINAIIQVRLDKGMQQRAVARAMSVSPSSVSALETNERRSPTLETLMRYANAVGVDIVVTPREVR